MMYQSPEERREHSRAEDRDLISRAIAGDQSAYGRLMEKYKNAIHHLVVRMVGYHEDVDDLTQEAFIKAFNSLASFNDEFAFSTWLYKIATNNCIDFLRKKKLKTFSINKPINAEDSDQQYEIPDDSNTPETGILQHQQSQTIQGAIETLPEKYRIVIELRHQQELSYEDIADKLDLPLGTVKAHIFRAREMLYKQLRGRI